MDEANNQEVEAEFKSSGIIAIAVNLLLCLVVLWVMYFLAFRVIPGKVPHTSRRGMPPGAGFVFLPFFGLLFFFILYMLRQYAFFIKIDPRSRTILFKNILTFQRTVYEFGEFDCYLDALVSSKGGTYKSIYLIKDEKAERIISGMYYGNMEELQAALSSIKYLGYQENFSIRSLKALMDSAVAK